jgi:hypothetical protein
LVSQGCHNKFPYIVWLKEENLIFSQFRRPEKWNESIFRLVPFLLVSVEVSLPLPLFWLLAVAAHPWYPWLIDASPQSLLTSPDDFLLCLCIFYFTLMREITEFRTTLIQDALISTPLLYIHL